MPAASIPLEELDIDGSNDWECSTAFTDMDVANRWHLTPGEWDAIPPMDKARMIAYASSMNKMEAYKRQQIVNKGLR